MTKRGILTIWALLMAVSAWTQGPPVKAMSITAKKGMKFSGIPQPGEHIDLVKLVPKSNVVLRGNVSVLFEEASAGKFRGGTMTVLVKDEMVHSVSLDAPNAKARKRLLKQLYKQFGDPYKLEVRNGYHYISWNPRNATNLNIEYQEDMDEKQSSALVAER